LDRGFATRLNPVVRDLLTYPTTLTEKTWAEEEARPAIKIADAISVFVLIASN